MADHHDVIEVRPDIDIEEIVMKVFHTYPPLAHSRSRVEITVVDGVVKATGWVKAAQTREVFVREASKVDGVKSVNVAELYDDESLRLKIGQITPFGVYTMVSYGAVVLTGTVPENTTAEKIVAKVEKMPGVRKVIPNF